MTDQTPPSNTEPTPPHTSQSDTTHAHCVNTSTKATTPKEKPPLGIAGKTAEYFIHSPLSPLLFFAMLFMGIMGLIFTPRQEDPQISVPMVDIFIQYPGASSQQVASLAIDPLQRIMSEIPGVKHVYSAAERGQGIVTIQFEVGEQMEQSIFKVHDKLQSNVHRIPPGVMPPLVKPKGIDDVPVVTLTLWSESVDDGTLRTLALDVMQDLNKIGDTGQSFIVGGRAEQVQIEIIPERLSSYNISLQQVAQTVQTANSEKNIGYVEIDNTHFSLYSGQFLRNAQDVSQLVVGTFRGAPVYMRDIANIKQGPEETKQLVNYFSGPAYGYKLHKHDPSIPVPSKIINGAPAVTIAVSKKIGSNGVSVANSVLRKVDNLKGHLIPDNVNVEITRNYGKTANDKVNDLIKKLFIATGAVTILVLYFLGLRPAIVVTLVIPVVILITVFSAWILGFTIDRVSLFALIFSIGILVDDAIVVVENIYRRWLEAGDMDTETAVDAVREVGNPTILATFTVVAALLPMGFVSGMMGPYMAPIPALGSVAMIFSLFAAFVFTPWLAMRIKPSLKGLHKQEQIEERSNERWEKFYRRIIPPLCGNKVLGMGFLLLLVFLFLFACSWFYMKWVYVKMLPLDNKPEFNVFIDMPEGTSMPSTANLTFQMAEKLRTIPEVTALQTYVGTSQPFDFNGMVRHYYLRSKPWHADIHVQLKGKKYRARSSHEIALEARRMLKPMATAMQAKITVVEMPPGPPVLQTVVAEVYGPDDKTRRQVAADLTKVFEQAHIVDDADNYMSKPYALWQFQVDTEKAVRRGISVDSINRTLEMAMGDFKLGDVKQGTKLEPTYIIMQVPLATRAQLTRLSNLPIPSQQGESVPLAELGRFVKLPEEPIIFQKNLRRIEYVVGDSVGVYDQRHNTYSESAPIYGMLEIEDVLRKNNYVAPDGTQFKTCMLSFGWLFSSTNTCNINYIAPPDGHAQTAYEWTGEWTVTYETFRDMGLAFAVAMVLIYMLVVSLFGNFLVPAVIMAPIPLTLLGIIPGHAFAGAEFTATSMIGWIALAGIIVRNSILLVDYSIQEVQKGTHIQEAVILACKTRTRPIIITALALVAGSFVIYFDPIFQGMAISLLCGVLVSTILTLVVIPLGCITIGPEALCASGGAPDAKKSHSEGDQGGTAGGTSRQHFSESRVGATLFFIWSLMVLVSTLLWLALQQVWQWLNQSREKPSPRGNISRSTSVDATAAVASVTREASPTATQTTVSEQNHTAIVVADASSSVQFSLVHNNAPTMPMVHRADSTLTKPAQFVAPVKTQTEIVVLPAQSTTKSSEAVAATSSEPQVDIIASPTQHAEVAKEERNVAFVAVKPPETTESEVDAGMPADTSASLESKVVEQVEVQPPVTQSGVRTVLTTTDSMLAQEQEKTLEQTTSPTTMEKSVVEAPVVEEKTAQQEEAAESTPKPSVQAEQSFQETLPAVDSTLAQEQEKTSEQTTSPTTMEKSVVEAPVVEEKTAQQEEAAEFTLKPSVQTEQSFQEIPLAEEEKTPVESMVTAPTEQDKPSAPQAAPLTEKTPQQEEAAESKPSVQAEQSFQETPSSVEEKTSVESAIAVSTEQDKSTEMPAPQTAPLVEKTAQQEEVAESKASLSQAASQTTEEKTALKPTRKAATKTAKSSSSRKKASTTTRDAKPTNKTEESTSKSTDTQKKAATTNTSTAKKKTPTKKGTSKRGIRLKTNLPAEDPTQNIPTQDPTKPPEEE